MKKYISLLLVILLKSTLTISQTKVVGYWPQYSNFPNGITTTVLSKITHLNIAFVNPDNNATLSGVNLTSLATVVTRAHNQNVKVFVSIAGGGGNATIYGNVLGNNTLRNTFVTNLVNYCVDNQLDGIDVDIEGGILHHTVSSNQYETFVTQLATELHAKGKLITSALSADVIGVVTLAAAQQYDWINLMSYDATGPWSGAGEHSTYNLMVNDLTAWNNKGIPMSKLVSGLPFYGYGFGTYDGSYTFSNLVANYPGAENNDIIGSGNNIITYNGIPTITKKTNYAVANCGGVMIWELSQDATGAKSLLTTIDNIVKSSVVNTPPSVSITSPTNNTTYTTPATVTITASASDQDGTVTGVQFFNGTVLLETDATAPYSFTWSGIAAGNYAITAKATDNSGNTSSSSVITITVNNPPQPIKEYTISKTNVPVVIDGVLDEKAWLDAPATDKLLNMNGTDALQTTTAKMLWSDTHLYLAFVVQDNSIWANFTARDSYLWNQDVMEVLIDKDGDATNYSEFGFAPNGTFYDYLMSMPYSAGGNATETWNVTGLTVKTTVSGTSNTSNGGVQWVCEVAIPFAGVPATPTTFSKPAIGDIWRLNVARADHNYNDANSLKLYTWTYTDGVTNHLPSRFGKVTFGPAPVVTALEVDKFSTLSFYPNPSSHGYYHVSKPITSTITNLQGEIVAQIYNSQLIDLSHVSAGVYIVNVDQQFYKLIKEK